MNYRVLALSSILLLLCGRSHAALVYSVDLDSSTPGIQNNIVVKAGASIVADIVMELTDSTSIGNYSVTLGFDVAELSYISGVESPPAPLVSLLALDNNTPGEINGIEAGVLAGNGPVAPLTVTIASLTFTAVAPMGDSTDLDLILFEDGVIDGSFDNGFTQLAPNFNGASVSVDAVPEPTGLWVALTALLMKIGICRRRTPSR